MVMHGIKSYLTLAAESTWGTTPGSPTYYHCPVTTYGVAMKRDRRNTSAFVGLRQRKHGRSFRGLPVGTLAANLYGWKPNGNSQSLAEYLLTWACANPEALDLPSQLAEWAEGPDVSNVRHNGLRVNSAVIEGSADTGLVTIRLELLGKSEAALTTAQSLPNDREACVEMDFSDCTFSLGGSAVQLRGFRWQVSNNLLPTYLNGTTPSHLPAGQRVESLRFQLLKSADTYSAWQRAFAEHELAGQIVLKGLHNGTGGVGTNYTVGTLDFPRLGFVAPEDQRNITSLVEQGLLFDVLKPDTSGDGVSMAWSEAA